MTKKTIQFKLPARTADSDLSSRDPDDAGQWVADPVGPMMSAEALGTFVSEAPACADNDQPLRPETATSEPSEGDEPFLAAGHPSRVRARAFLRDIGDAADCGIVLTLGLQAISREWLSMPLDAVQKSFDSLQIMHCRSLSELVALQASLMRSNIEDALARGGRIARISMHVIGEANHAAFGLHTGGKA